MDEIVFPKPVTILRKNNRFSANTGLKSRAEKRYFLLFFDDFRARTPISRKRGDFCVLLTDFSYYSFGFIAFCFEQL